MANIYIVLTRCPVCSKHLRHCYSFNTPNSMMREELLFPLYRAGNWGTPRLLSQEHTTRKWQSLFLRCRALFLSLRQKALSSSLHSAHLQILLKSYLLLWHKHQSPQGAQESLNSQSMFCHFNSPGSFLMLPYFVKYVFIKICCLSPNSCGDQKKKNGGGILKLPYISLPPQHPQPHNVMSSAFTQ